MTFSESDGSPHRRCTTKFAPFIAFPIIATGSLTLPFLGDGVTVHTGGFGLADTWVEPVNLGWHLPRGDVWAGYAFMAPTGKYTPGAVNNIGSGYWGNNFNGGGTFYLTKDMGTTANIMGNVTGAVQRNEGPKVAPAAA